MRKNFFGRHRLLEMVAKMSDEDIWRLNRGGHDPQKVYAAFRGGQHQGQPTVLLVKTVKGFGMGKAGEGKNIAHQAKKLGDDDVRTFRDRFIPIPDEKLADIPFYKPEEHTPEMQYLHAPRKALGGYLPKRRAEADEQLSAWPRGLQGRDDPTAEGREISTTQAYVRVLTALLRDQELRVPRGPHPGGRGAHFRHGGAVPPDRHLQPRRTKYTPQDRDQVSYYKEDVAGQILQERHQRGGRHGQLDRGGDERRSTSNAS